MRQLGSISLCLLLLLLAGCGKKHASVSESQCAAGDWQTVGYRDGAYGYRSTRLLAHQDACVPHGVVPDRTTYMVGWREGVAEYCQADNGYAVGVRGAAYHNVCPAGQEPAFLAAYAEGRGLYDARTAVGEIERAIQYREQRLVALEADVVHTGTAQLNPLLTPAQRIELAAKSKRLLDERARIEGELPLLRRDLERARHELAHIEQAPASFGD